MVEFCNKVYECIDIWDSIYGFKVCLNDVSWFFGYNVIVGFVLKVRVKVLFYFLRFEIKSWSDIFRVVYIICVDMEVF